MKIIIFIIIACMLFVAWSLCIVGASADEQLEMIYAKDLERKENSMDNTYAPTENKEQEKIKVESIDTIVTMHGDKPYYENKYREVGDKCYHIGYAVWNKDVKDKDERLDDGSTDIDSLDAFEYTIERDMRDLIEEVENV